MTPCIIGYDTETRFGLPITAQFYSEDVPKVTTIFDVNGKTVTQQIFKHLSKTCRTGFYIVLAHNLDYDTVSLFYPKKHLLIENPDRTFDFTYDQFEVSGIYDGQLCFFTMQHTKRELKFLFIDSFSWFKASLDNTSKIVSPHLPKLRKPKGLGTRHYTSKDDVFAEYAMRDAEIAYHAGKVINGWHREYDIDQTFSAAGMARHVFQRHYVEDPIWRPPTRDEKLAALKSYKGGKNSMLPEAGERWHHNIDSWDISSAYPHAMSDLPAFSKVSLYRDFAMFPNRTRHFPPHGVYCVSGVAPDCKWPVFIRYSDKLKKHTGVRGKFDELWVTGYELNEARRAGEIKITSVWGHYYDSESDPVTDTALQRFIADFYAKKQSAPDRVSRELYKLLINSIYGKFVEQTDYTAPDGSIRKKAGAIWHPLIATLTTGHTRSVMHRLEHDTKAIHASTDGVLCNAKDSPTTFAWAPQDGLGSIESEARNLTVAMFRNKLYLAFAKTGKTKSRYFEGLYYSKDISHSFLGTARQLEHMAVSGKRSYTHKRRVTLRQQRDGENANDFVRETRQLKNVGPLKGRQPKRKQ